MDVTKQAICLCNCHSTVEAFPFYRLASWTALFSSNQLSSVQITQSNNNLHALFPVDKDFILILFYIYHFFPQKNLLKINFTF